jgi:hypothetical protein
VFVKISKKITVEREFFKEKNYIFLGFRYVFGPFSKQGPERTISAAFE